MPRRVSSRKLQDYVEGRLEQSQLAEVEAYLKANPEIAVRVEKLRLQARRTRKLGKTLLSEEIPQRLLDIIAKKPQ
jgi:anti-sigma factor RsiW